MKPSFASRIDRRASKPVIVRLIAVAAIGVAMTGCKKDDDYGAQVAGWTVTDASQRHPIMVSQKPANLSIRVARGSHGLAASQKAQIVQFLDKYRAGDAGNSKLVVSVPSGAPNEIAAMSAITDMRPLFAGSGFSESTVSVEPYYAEGDPQPPIRISYLRYTAEGPECGRWPDALGTGSGRNTAYHNFGCAQQKNLAAMIANPADLVTPRTSTPAPAERRDGQMEKYKKGEMTGSPYPADGQATKN